MGWQDKGSPPLFSFSPPCSKTTLGAAGIRQTAWAGPSLAWLPGGARMGGGHGAPYAGTQSAVHESPHKLQGSLGPSGDRQLPKR